MSNVLFIWCPIKSSTVYLQLFIDVPKNVFILLYFPSSLFRLKSNFLLGFYLRIFTCLLCAFFSVTCLLFSVNIFQVLT